MSTHIQKNEVFYDLVGLFLSAQDMFVGLTDEKNRIEIPDRRDGKPGRAKPPCSTRSESSPKRKQRTLVRAADRRRPSDEP